MCHHCLDYEIGREDLIAQLGLLILESRKPQDTESNIKDHVNCDDHLIHHRKVCSPKLYALCAPVFFF